MSAGIEVKFKNQLYPVLIAATHVPELTQVTCSDTGVTFGASTTLSTIDETLKALVEKHPGLLSISFYRSVLTQLAFL